MDWEEFEEEVEERSKKPLAVIFAFFIIFVFLISIIPVWQIAVNPPPDREAIANFELTELEKIKLEEIEYNSTSNIQLAISQIQVADYRAITGRLVTEACSTNSDICYAKSIYYFVQGHSQYVPDPELQYVESPGEVLLARASDCEGIALTTAVMLEAVGIDADLGVTHNHAFVRAQVKAPFWDSKNGYVWLDPTSSEEFGDIPFRDEPKGFYEVA